MIILVSLQALSRLSLPRCSASAQTTYADALYAKYAFPTVEENLRTHQQVVVDVKPDRWLKIVEDECATEPSEHPSAGTESQHD